MGSVYFIPWFCPQGSHVPSCMSSLFKSWSFVVMASIQTRLLKISTRAKFLSVLPSDAGRMAPMVSWCLGTSLVFLPVPLFVYQHRRGQRIHRPKECRLTWSLSFLLHFYCPRLSFPDKTSVLLSKPFMNLSLAFLSSWVLTFYLSVHSQALEMAVGSFLVKTCKLSWVNLHMTEALWCGRAQKKMWVRARARARIGHRELPPSDKNPSPCF